MVLVLAQPACRLRKTCCCTIPWYLSTRHLGHWCDVSTVGQPVMVMNSNTTHAYGLLPQVLRVIGLVPKMVLHACFPLFFADV